MTTEQKLFDEVVELLDLLGQNANIAVQNSDVIWSGNEDDYVVGSNRVNELIRFKIERLKLNTKIVNKKFQVHFANLSRATKQITDINEQVKIKDIKEQVNVES